MRLLRNLSAAVGLALAVLAVASFDFAVALTSPPTFAPRQFLSQQVAYTRIHIKFSSTNGQTINGQPCVIVSNACKVKVGALPYNAYVIRGTQQIITNFNSGSTDTVAIGTTQANANELVAAQSVHSGAGNQTTLTIASAGSGVQVTGNSVAQTGADGGFDLWVLYAQTSTAPTAGEVVIILEWIPPNDGDCVAVGFGSTAGAC